MTKSVRNMRLSGGHPALDFINTVDSRRGRWGPDLLRDYVDLINLGERTGLISAAQVATLEDVADASPDAAAKALRFALSLRESLYRVFLEEDEGPAPPPDDIAFVETALVSASRRQVFQRDVEGWAWRPKVEIPSDLVHMLSLSAAALLSARAGRRPVKECKGDNCGWLFLDTSKGGRRIWCSEASCGVHSRVKRFRGG